jgi:NTP pyrophosphatase (non-canonical NTP hydrolase)
MSQTHHHFQVLRLANSLRQIEWDAHSKITPSYMGNELAGEVGEACNIIKKLERESYGMRGSRASIPQLADELADVIICVDLIAARFNIDLWSAVVEKFNKTSVKNELKTKIIEKV